MINLSKDNNETDIRNDMIDAIINEELSEEEFAKDREVIFKRPPHTSSELKEVLEQAEKIYEENKFILLENDEKLYNDIKEDFFKKIPVNFILRTLSYPVTGTNIMLCGVQKRSSIHSFFLTDLLNNIDPDQIVIQQAPDDPIFIDGVNSYEDGNFLLIVYVEWKSFLRKGTNSNFLINPLPKSISDIVITHGRISKLIDKSLLESTNFQIGKKIIISKQSNKHK